MPGCTSICSSKTQLQKVDTDDEELLRATEGLLEAIDRQVPDAARAIGVDICERYGGRIEKWQGREEDEL
jgi:hypothetical protein